MSQKSINNQSLIQYSFISVPLAFAGFPLYVLAPDFYATHHGLSLNLLGSLLLGMRLFDAIQDPVIGWIADKVQGNFVRLIIMGGVMLCVSIFALFNNVFFSPILWFGCCMLVAISSYSLLTIILGTQATLWTEDKHDQTRIAGMREACGLMGLVMAVSMPTILSGITRAENIYKWYGGILAGLMVVGILCFSKIDFGPSKNNIKQSTENLLIDAAFRSLPRETLMLFAVYGLSMLASSIPAVLVIFYVRDWLGAEHFMGLFLVLYFLSGATGMQIWKKLSTYYGKYIAWGISNILAVIGFIGAFFLGKNDASLYAIICVISGLALGADLTLPPSILADHIHRHSNSRFAGMHYACLVFIAKISLAFASAITFFVLDFKGFKPAAHNSDEALIVLCVAYALIPCALKIMSAALLYMLFILRVNRREIQ